MKRTGRILVVESNDLIRDLLERWLSEAGYEVVVEALQGLPQAIGAGDGPRLVIIDVQAPRSAEGIIRSVRDLYAGPVLLLSASFRLGTGSSSSVARQLGVSNVLPIPFPRKELLSAVAASIEEEE